MVAPASLQAVLALMAQQPGAWLPIAGGTDVMVQYAAGILPLRKLVSIWNLPELRGIQVLADEIQVGAGCTYTELREHEVINSEFGLLALAAEWTGGIANQNRGTIGGNIVNASPAADSLPALLVYDAELILSSARGERRVPYSGFHTGYRKTQLAAEELIRAICLKRSYAGYHAHARKVGARNAQAISKVSLAGLGQLTPDGAIADIRLAMGSVAPVPLRLRETERTVRGKTVNGQLLELAGKTASNEVRPIDDIRSTARYRAAVAGNLVREFLEQLAGASGAPRARSVLTRWNGLGMQEAATAILPCCGSRAWANRMASRRPIPDEPALLLASEDSYQTLTESDWDEAFRSHPRIGGPVSNRPAAPQSAWWSSEEQSRVATAGEAEQAQMADLNGAYESKFGRIFIVCASGKSADEILEILHRRLENDERTEFLEAAQQQRQITQIRLKKWLGS
jgi:OHCU decarboxylase